VTNDTLTDPFPALEHEIDQTIASLEKVGNVQPTKCLLTTCWNLRFTYRDLHKRNSTILATRRGDPPGSRGENERPCKENHKVIWLVFPYVPSKYKDHSGRQENVNRSVLGWYTTVLRCFLHFSAHGPFIVLSTLSDDRFSVGSDDERKGRLIATDTTKGVRILIVNNYESTVETSLLLEISSLTQVLLEQ
jgi:hypothetical protein